MWKFIYMISETTDQNNDQKNMPIHMDYFCPFCGTKLFRGRVSTLKMVCSGCNKLVLIKDIEDQHHISDAAGGY
jgi:DNA-directed RNA polymerase subunit RPC12/RpoP